MIEKIEVCLLAIYAALMFVVVLPIAALLLFALYFLDKIMIFEKENTDELKPYTFGFSHGDIVRFKRKGVFENNMLARLRFDDIGGFRMDTLDTMHYNKQYLPTGPYHWDSLRYCQLATKRDAKQVLEGLKRIYIKSYALNVYNNWLERLEQNG